MMHQQQKTKIDCEETRGVEVPSPSSSEVRSSHRFILQDDNSNWNNWNTVASHSRRHFISIKSQPLLEPSLVIRRKLASSHAVGCYCLLVLWSSLHNLVSNSSYWLQHYVAALQLTVFVRWRLTSRASSLSTRVYVCMFVKVRVLEAFSWLYVCSIHVLCGAYTNILGVFGSRRVMGSFGKVFSLKLKSLDYHCGFKTGFNERVESNIFTFFLYLTLKLPATSKPQHHYKWFSWDKSLSKDTWATMLIYLLSSLIQLRWVIYISLIHISLMCHNKREKELIRWVSHFDWLPCNEGLKPKQHKLGWTEGFGG